MPKLIRFCFLFVAMQSFVLRAQTGNCRFLNETAESRLLIYPGFQKHKLLFPQVINYSTSLTPFVFDPSVPKGAVFCRMENNICFHYNIWLKIRAGDVDMYHRMIEVRN
ncbi:MAG TPA: hypothetical protein VGO45_01235 [Bacteroidia bacterium]|jgi:hypothetical protein|nr:hypothetical protein [Bacteroidia bacterium]